MKYMKIRRLLLLSLFILGCLGLTACGDTEEDMNSPEATTELVSTQENESDSSSNYVTQTIETDWDGCTITTDAINYDPTQEPLEEDGFYTSEVDVATYIIEYHTLPSNFITKKEAKKKGWSGGSLDEYGEELCIGGDYFGNYEGLLPEVEGRNYYECDIDTMNSKKRGAKRIIYSDDGQIYYTDDHYESFTLIYGSDE